MLPPWPKVKIFLLGAVWAVLASLGPVAILVYDWLKRWDDPIDWGMVIHLAEVTAGTALVMYWRKYKALLQIPPATAANPPQEPPAQ